jgi:hypothetical protein
MGFIRALILAQLPTKVREAIQLDELMKLREIKKKK